MALIDLKSDLSRFRMPKEDPLVKKKRVDVNRKQNQTPLSSFLKSRPDISTPQQTPTKQGSSVNKFSNSSNFLGETTPNEMDNSSNFLGQTTPSKMDNSTNFLGETCPNTFDNSSKFLGETTQNKFTFNPNHEDTAKTPKRVDFFPNDKAKGFTFNFKNKDNTKFVGINPANTIFDSTNSLFSNFSNSFQGIGFSAGYEGFKPIGKFTGDTQRYNPDSMYTTGMFSKELSKPKNGILHLQTDASAIPFIASQYIKYTWESLGKLGIQAGYANFKLSDKLQGGFYLDTNQYTTAQSKFSSRPVLKTNSRSILSLHEDNAFFEKMYDKFNLRNNIENPKFSIGNVGVGSINFPTQPFVLSGIQKRGGTSGGFDVPTRDDLVKIPNGFIRGGIVTSTVRAAVDITRIGSFLLTPQGFTFIIKQLGLQATNKYGKFYNPLNLIGAVGGQHIGFRPQRSGLIPFLDPSIKYAPLKNRGVTGVVNNPFQATTIYQIVKNTARTDFATKGALSTAQAVSANLSDIPLVGKYLKLANVLRVDAPGGFDTLYGIGVSLTTRFENTFANNGIRFGNFQAGSPLFKNVNSNVSKAISLVGGVLGVDVLSNFNKPYEQKFNPFVFPFKYSPSDDILRHPKNSVPARDELKLTFGLAGQGGNISSLPSISKKASSNKLGEAGVLPLTVKDYETVPYGDLSYNSAVGKNTSGLSNIKNALPVSTIKTTPTDFRLRKKSVDFAQNKGDLRTYKKNNDYDKFNLDTSADRNIKMGNPGKIRTKAFDKYKWFNTDLNNDTKQRINSVNGRPLKNEDDTPIRNDLVHLWFRGRNDGKIAQFSGVVSGINESFSPGWEPIKYNGRADQAFRYGTFSRTLNFNFSVIATSRIEMIPLWNKLQYLSSLTMPIYGAELGYKGELIDFRLGDLYNRQLAFINQLSYSMRDDMSWEISPKGSDNPIGELPRGIDITIGLQILGTSNPRAGSTSIYSFYNSVKGWSDKTSKYGDKSNPSTEMSQGEKDFMDAMYSGAG